MYLHLRYDSDKLPPYFMGQSLPKRQDAIIKNLRVKKALIEA